MVARGFGTERKVRTPWAGRWVTPRRSNPTPAPQKTNRRWPTRQDPNLVAAAQVRVKRWGKSPPRGWRHHRHGKRRLVQGQIGRHVQRSSRTVVRRLARSRSSGRLLEVRGNSNPREMIIQAKRATSLRDRIRLIGLPLTLLLKRLVASALGDSRGAVLTGLDGDVRISNLSP